MDFRKQTLLLTAAICLFGALGVWGAEDKEVPRVLREDFPKAFFFRSAEGMAAQKSVVYSEWDAAFSRLMGIMGKALDEEVLGRGDRNPEFFTRFKKAHPDQVVLLHFNGNARDPRFRAEKFFAGHWVYHPGVKIIEDLPAQSGEMDIRLSAADLFQVEMGRYKNANDDVGLCELDPSGKPDWSRSEQVRLISVDKANKTIRVERGCYGTKPRAFRAGRAYAAAHATEGPWGQNNNIMWFYNYSTRCPRDAKGKVCSDYLLDDLAEWFGPGGELEAFDGLEFDVLNHYRSSRRGLDCDADGKADNGLFDGVNTYGAGVVEFCRRLRERLGEDRLILADGMNEHSQRAFGLLNGIESEGWPHLRDHEITDWAGGLNRHFFWDANGREPVFNYVNHKFNVPSGRPGVVKKPDVPYSTHRLVFAAGMFTNAAICYSLTPPPDRRGEAIGVWDELRMGTENRLGWLGRPKGPAVRLAKKTPDLLQAEGAPPKKSLLDRFVGENTRFELDGDRIKITAANADAKELRFRFMDVPCAGPDLFVSLTARGEPMAGYPREVARIVHAALPAHSGSLMDPGPPETGFCLRGAAEREIEPGYGAAVLYKREEKLAGRGFEAYQVHPPYGAKGTGYTFWSKRTRVPAKAVLRFFTGMGPKAPGRSDGVEFRVEVAQVRNGKRGAFTRIFTHSQKESLWVEHTVPLDRWAGKLVELKFISDAGPRDNATTDHSLWGGVRVESAVSTRSRAARYMTFLNQKDFESGFYFQGVQGDAVELRFAVEGNEPVWISNLTVHAHPDAMVREFENGAVVANPSERPYEIDLDSLYPGARFRRLRGSAAQDPETNNGKPVGKRLKLGAKDALFLVRQTLSR